MDLQRLLNSRQAGVLAFRLSQAMPVNLGYRLADWLAKRIAARRDLPLVQAIRCNQWVARGEPNDPEALDRAVEQNLSVLGRSFFEVFHNMNHPERMESLIEFNPALERIISESQKGERGLLVLGVHMGNFDMVMQAAAQRGLQALGLSLPKESEAIEWQHQFRRSAGLEILPTSSSSMRIAIERMQQGATVLTGVDHPLEKAKYKPRLFGQPANLPVHYVQLALKAEVPVIVLASVKDKDGKYKILLSGEIYLESYAQRHEQIIRNAEMILKVAESFIQPHLEQWTLVQPVWPEAIARMP